MIKFVPLKPTDDQEENRKLITSLISKVQAVLQKPRLSLNPGMPPIVQITEDIIQAMSTDDLPAQPILVLPGSIIQCYVPHLSKIIALIFGGKNAIQVFVTSVIIEEPANQN